MAKVTKIEISRPIKTLGDLKYQKDLLENKALKKERKLFKKTQKLKKKVSAQAVYTEILEDFELNESIILNILPIALKKINASKEYFNTSNKKVAIYSGIGALLAILTTLFVQKKQTEK